MTDGPPRLRVLLNAPALPVQPADAGLYAVAIARGLAARSPGVIADWLAELIRNNAARKQWSTRGRDHATTMSETRATAESAGVSRAALWA